MNDVSQGMTTCIRCQNATAPETPGLCPACAVRTRLELAAGLRRLTDYLAKWAAFDEWCRSRRDGTAFA